MSRYLLEFAVHVNNGLYREDTRDGADPDSGKGATESLEASRYTSEAPLRSRQATIKLLEARLGLFRICTNL